MMQFYFIAGIGALILGLWATITILRSRKQKAEFERDIAKTLVRESKKVIKHEKEIQAKIKSRSVDVKNRIKEKMEDVENNNFDSFYD